MPFTDESQIKVAFKKLIGRAHTTNDKEFFNEAKFSQISIFAFEVFGQEIPSDPQAAVDAGLVEYVEADLVLDGTSNGKSYVARFPAGYNGYFGSGVAGSDIGPIASAIPASINSSLVDSGHTGGFAPGLYDNGVLVPATSTEDWVFDPVAMIVTSEDDLSLASTGTLQIYLYIGDTVQDHINNTNNPHEVALADLIDLNISGSMAPDDGDLLIFVGGSLNEWQTIPSSSVGVTDHGDLTGLSDDDHTQYVTNSPALDARNVIQPTSSPRRALRIMSSSDGPGTWDFFDVTEAGGTQLMRFENDSGDYSLYFENGLATIFDTNTYFNNFVALTDSNDTPTRAVRLAAPTTLANIAGYTITLPTTVGDAGEILIVVDGSSIESELGWGRLSINDLVDVVIGEGLQDGYILQYVGGSIDEWQAVNPGGIGGGVTDHGALDGLSDDDHTQYVVKTPGSSTRNRIQPTSNYTALSLKAFSASSGPLFLITDTSDQSLFQVDQSTGNISFGGATSSNQTLLATNASGTQKTATFPDVTGQVMMTTATQTVTGTTIFTSLDLAVQGGGAFSTFFRGTATTTQIIDIPDESGTLVLAGALPAGAGQFLRSTGASYLASWESLSLEDLPDISLDDLSDVIGTGANDGDVLVYVGGSLNYWEPQAIDNIDNIAPADASYITAVTESSLPQSRLLVQGTGIQILDSGGGSNLVIASNDSEIDHSALLNLTQDDHTQYVITSPSSSARNLVTASSSTVIPLTLRGAASHSVNLFVVENSAGTDLVYVESSGNLVARGSIKGGGSAGTADSVAFILDNSGLGGGPRTFTFPNTAGQIMTINSSQTITGTKTFTLADLRFTGSSSSHGWIFATSKTSGGFDNLNVPGITTGDVTMLITENVSVTAGEVAVAASTTVGAVDFRPLAFSDLPDISLDDLSDVIGTGASDGDILVYVGGSLNYWEPSAFSDLLPDNIVYTEGFQDIPGSKRFDSALISGIGLASTQLSSQATTNQSASFPDASGNVVLALSNPTEAGQFFVAFDSSNTVGEWKSIEISDLPDIDLDDLADVDAPSPTDGYVLTYVGGSINSWQAQPLPSDAVGILSLNSQTGSSQTFSESNDTNVTISISSSSNDHEFAMGWNGQLAIVRGGTGASSQQGAINNLAGFTTRGDLLVEDSSGDASRLALGASGTVLYSDGSDPTWTALTTDEVSEGSNLYFTEERVDDRVAALIQDGIGLTWTYTDGSNTLVGDVSLSPFDTGDLAEGSNLYFTNERVDDRVAALIQDGTGLSWTYVDGSDTLTGNVSLAPFDTDDLSEGSTNLYWTDVRFDESFAEAIGNTLLTELLDVNTPTPADGYVLTYVGGSIDEWRALPLPSDSVGIQSINGQTGSIQTFSDSDDTNVTLTITSSANDHEFALGWTGDLSVSRGGTGLSTLTDGAVLVGNGTSAVQSVAMGAGEVLIGNGAGSDPSSAELIEGTGISITSGAGSIEISTNDSEIDHGSLAGLSDDDHSQYIHDSPSSSARNLIGALGTTVTPLTLRGAPGHTADMLVIENSGGTDLATFSSAGALTLSNASGHINLETDSQSIRIGNTTGLSGAAIYSVGDGSARSFVLDYYGTTGTASPEIILRRARGSASSPGNLSTVGDDLGAISWFGYNSSAGSFVSTARIIAETTQSFAANAAGTKLEFQTLDESIPGSPSTKLRLSTEGVRAIDRLYLSAVSEVTSTDYVLAYDDVTDEVSMIAFDIAALSDINTTGADDGDILVYEGGSVDQWRPYTIPGNDGNLLYRDQSRIGALPRVNWDDAEQALIVGVQSTAENAATTDSLLEFIGNSTKQADVCFTQVSGDATAGGLVFWKARGSLNALANVQDNDRLGEFFFYGQTGIGSNNGFGIGGSITMDVDGTPTGSAAFVPSTLSINVSNGSTIATMMQVVNNSHTAFLSDIRVLNQNAVRFYETGSANYIEFQAAGTMAGNITYTWPDADGSATDYLSTNGGGVLSWSDATGLLDSHGANRAVHVNSSNNGLTSASAVTISGNEITLGNSGTQGEIYIVSGGSGGVAFQELPFQGDHVAKIVSESSYSADFELTLPGITGTFMMLEGTQTVSGDKTFESGTFNLAGSSSGVATLTYAATATDRSYIVPVTTTNSQTLVIAETETDSSYALFATATSGSPEYRAITTADIEDFSLGSAEDNSYLRYVGGSQNEWISDVIPGVNGNIFYNNDGIFGAVSEMNWDEANEALILGSGLSKQFSTLPGLNFEIAGEGSGVTGMNISTSGTTAAPLFVMSRSRGTLSAQTNVSTSDYLGQSVYYGYNSSAGTGYALSALLEIRVDNFTSATTYLPARFEFRVGNSTGTSLLTPLIVNGDGLSVSGDVLASGNVVISGDLTVQGTTTTIDTQNLIVEDNFIVVNSMGIVQNAGIEVDRGHAGSGNNAFLLFDEDADEWYVDNSQGTWQIARKLSATITGTGGDSTFTVTHGMNTTDVVVQVYNSSGVQVSVQITASDPDEVDITFKTAPAPAVTYQVVVVG
tara:strand:+ start:269017 stop:276552 length:7536 start_codon:yes stop_codon:yes gene_type:complete